MYLTREGRPAGRTDQLWRGTRIEASAILSVLYLALLDKGNQG
jgi:hypothetical protein